MEATFLSQPERQCDNLALGCMHVTFIDITEVYTLQLVHTSCDTLHWPLYLSSGHLQFSLFSAEQMRQQAHISPTTRPSTHRTLT